LKISVGDSRNVRGAAEAPDFATAVRSCGRTETSDSGQTIARYVCKLNEIMKPLIYSCFGKIFPLFFVRGKF